MVIIPKGLRKWIAGDLFVLDEAGNAIAFDGNPRITISAHCGAQIVAKKECLPCKVICGFIQNGLGRIWPRLKNHCVNSWTVESVVAGISDAENMFGTHPKQPGG